MAPPAIVRSGAASPEVTGPTQRFADIGVDDLAQLANSQWKLTMVCESGAEPMPRYSRQDRGR